MAAIAADNKTPIERYNDYGFTIGGPLFIPKVYHPVKNKTFFFWSEEWRKASLPATNTINVPTTSQLAGAFHNSDCGRSRGMRRRCWRLHTISPTCFSQNAAAYLNAFMVNNPPNSPGLLITPYSALNNFRQDIIRLDQNIGDKVRVYGRYMQDVVPQNAPFSLWGGGNYPGVETTSINAPGRNLVINATATISPRVVNEVEFVDSWGAINSDLTNALANSPAFTGQLTNNTAFADPYGRAPNVSISGYTGLGNGSAPYHERNISKTIFDNLSIQRGNHTIRSALPRCGCKRPRMAMVGAANFNFSSANNGNDPFANFLLGQADSYSQANHDTVPHLRYLNFETYVQDDWKITSPSDLEPRRTIQLFPLSDRQQQHPGELRPTSSTMLPCTTHPSSTRIAAT